MKQVVSPQDQIPSRNVSIAESGPKPTVPSTRRSNGRKSRLVGLIPGEIIRPPARPLVCHESTVE